MTLSPNTLAPAAGELAQVDEYLRGEFQRVQGWCLPQLWQAIQPLHEEQNKLGVKSPIAEIGVFKGKFFIGLVKTKAAVAGGHHAFDVFDLQQFNLDHAGKGELEAFQTNLVKSGVKTESVAIMRGDSMTIGIDERLKVKRETGGFSMFSVDGCHLAGHTINDIRIAIDLTVPEGIIFVDDYYNASWPGVQEGVAKLYLCDSPTFVPLLYMSNKLFLCHVSYHDRYIAAVFAFIKQNYPETVQKKVERFGYPTLTVIPKPTPSQYVI